MLKIDFFTEKIQEYYKEKILENIRSRNGTIDEIIFIPGEPYKINIEALLTAERKKIFETDGIKLYMTVCSAQKYKSMSNVELLFALNSVYPDKVNKIKHERGDYEYELGDVHYRSNRINDRSAQDIIEKATGLIRDEFAQYNANYADKYFYKKIKCVKDLKAILENMFSGLKQTLCINGSAKPVIDYSLISGDLRHKLLSSINTRTCPYCNRNYITRYGADGSKSTADLDHFYQKEQYPLFALSLFNFVPSCPTCNSRMKNIHPADDSLYPYEEAFDDDARFDLKYIGDDNKNEDILHLWQAFKDVKYSDFNVEIVIGPDVSPEKRRKIEKSKDLFHLTEVYDDHKPEALEAALRTRIYCEGSYKEFCEKLFENCRKSGMVNSSVSDLESYLFGVGFDDEWLMFGIFPDNKKRKFDKPLSKMIYDIYRSSK